MELFVFVRMGGKRADILVELLGDATADLTASLAKFDAGKARCYLDRDRQGLLAVIESSFGSFAPFNKLVRGIFSKELNPLNMLVKQATRGVSTEIDDGSPTPSDSFKSVESDSFVKTRRPCVPIMCQWVSDWYVAHACARLRAPSLSLSRARAPRARDTPRQAPCASHSVWTFTL